MASNKDPSWYHGDRDVQVLHYDKVEKVYTVYGLSNTTAPHSHWSEGPHDLNRSGLMPIFLSLLRVFLV